MEYQVEKSTSPAITSVGRMPRKDGYKCIVVLPVEVKARLDELIQGGTISSALSGLVIYAIDHLEKNDEKLIIRNAA